MCYDTMELNKCMRYVRVDGREVGNGEKDIQVCELRVKLGACTLGVKVI